MGDDAINICGDYHLITACNGAELRATMTRDGVDVTHVGDDPSAATGVAFIAVDAAGQNSIIVQRE